MIRQTPHENIIDQIYNGTIYYQDLSKDLKRNRQIATAAIIYDPDNILRVDKPLLDDYNLMLDVLSYHGHLIQYFPSSDIFEDYQIVLTAVSSDGMVLKDIFNYEIKYMYYCDIERVERDGIHFIERDIISDEKKNFINNFEIVFAAVSQNGLSLDYASNELKNNFEIVSAAVNQNGKAIEFVSEELQMNMTLIVNALAQTSEAIWYIPFKFRVMFQNIIEHAQEENIEYFYDKIKNGTLYPCSQIWIQYFTSEKIMELNKWIGIIKNEYYSLFKVLFNNHNQKLGYYDPIRSNILSFFDSSDLHKTRQVIINDILLYMEWV